MPAKLGVTFLADVWRRPSVRAAIPDAVCAGRHRVRWMMFLGADRAQRPTREALPLLAAKTATRHKCRLLLSLGILRRSSDRLNTQVELLFVLAVSPPQHILGGITQLANGRIMSLFKPDIELNSSKPVCVGIHELPPGGPSFRPHPPAQFWVEINTGFF